MPGITSGDGVLLGPDGEQFNTYSTKRWPFGTKLILQDGREYRFGKAGAADIPAGKLCQMAVPGANFDELALPAAVPIGTRTFQITNGATTIALHDFDEGFLNIEDDTGEGSLYKVEKHDAEGAGSAAFNVTLAPGNGIRLALTTSTTVGITPNPYNGVIIHPSPATAKLVGVTPAAIVASKFGWFQITGPASVLTEGTLVINERCVDSASADGAVTPIVLTEGTPNVAAGQFSVGTCMEVAATTEHSLVWLDID